MYPCASLRSVFLTGLLVLAMLAPPRLHAEDKDKNDTSTKESSRTATDQIYEPGNGVKSPKLIHYVEPEFSGSSKEAYVEGVVRISVIVKNNGIPGDMHVVKGLNSDEDHRALDAVSQWRFQPGTKDGQPVNVRVTVEVEFHLL